MVDERTSLFAEPRPAPSYVLPGRYPRTHQRQMKRFQCCICLSFLSVLVIVLAILITYAIFETNDPTDKVNDNNDRNNQQSPTPRAKDSIETDLIRLLTLVAWPIADEPSTKWKMFNISDMEHEQAIRAGIIALGDKDLFEENMPTPLINSPSFRSQKAVSTTAEARKLTKRGYVENHATIELAKTYFPKPKGRWNIGQGPYTHLSHSTPLITCNFNARYRNSDGTCNNKNYPLSYGVALTPFRRALNPDYADGISAPRVSSRNQSLPSARLLTTSIHRPSYNTDPNFTVMLAVFGQFLDHDITATALNQGQDGEPIDCCAGTNEPMHPECFPVYIGPFDPNYVRYNISCMNFVRSAPAPTGSFGPRQQLNQASSFIDGSAVYGHTDEKVNALRTYNNGSLRMFNTPDNRTLLPVSTDPKDGCNQVERNSKGEYCFDTGDNRANENLLLTSMHLIWARHHNYLAQSLQEINPDWSDEILFQEARKILAAQLQHITYNEFLPVLFGDEFCQQTGILSDENKLDTYDPTVNPSVANVFASCVFRFAHTLIPGLMHVTKDVNSTEAVALHRMLFNPYSLWANGGLDSAINSAVQTPLSKSDQYFTSELTDKLFQDNAKTPVAASVKKQPGLDLVSLNIQRGRDHGLPSYSEWRKHCQLPTVDTWEDMQFAVDYTTFTEMKKTYRDAIDVDLYTGALSEPPLTGAIVGPTLLCLLSDQFIRLKRGDSHWYERHVGPQRFSKDQLNEIDKTTLAAIICRNSDTVYASQKYVMKRVGVDNPILNCTSLDTFDFAPWKHIKTSESVFEKQNFIKVSNDGINVAVVTEKSNAKIEFSTISANSLIDPDVVQSPAEILGNY